MIKQGVNNGSPRPGTEIGFWKKRTLRKASIGLLRHAAFARSTREDVASSSDLAKLDAAANAVRKARKDREFGEMAARLDCLSDAVQQIMPPRPWPTLREYVEIVVVALGVAMACRSYFLQPFKIPTGSMQPSLYGIHYERAREAGALDSAPLKHLKWLVTGESYVELRAGRTGRIAMVDPRSGYMFNAPLHDGCFQTTTAISTGGNVCGLAEAGMYSHVTNGEYVVSGQILCTGMKVAGDHVFVDRISWNFRKPKRSEVMVFLTTDIHDGLPQDTHYIKRMVGLPGDSLTVDPPRILTNGIPITDYKIGAIGRGELGNGGYKLADPVWGGADGSKHPGMSFESFINESNRSIHLNADQYLACGDNTRSSLDGRYWGPVPRNRLVGPALVVYWPLSKRWGHISR